MSNDFRVLDIMKDKRIDCFSIMLSMKVKEYLDIIEKAYENNGGIEGQRVALTNRSAIRIRENMKNDIKKGTVLPPVVIGSTVDDMDSVTTCMSYIQSEDYKAKLIDILNNNELSIIDGMQRTTALREICSEDDSFNLDLRVELWITNSANNLIYRMLVLNTGQISWKLKKQLEVVFAHVKVELKRQIPELELIESNDSGRSTSPGKYQVSHLVELYLSFCTRKVDVNISEQVAEEFAKQDIIEKSYNESNLKYFVGIIKHLVNLDSIFSSQNGLGKRLFGDQNARVGFIVSIATEIFGRPGRKKRADEDVQDIYNDLEEKLGNFVVGLNNLKPEELNEFYQLESLKEFIGICPKKELSAYYKKAFDVLIEENFDIDEIDNMEICWNCQF